MSRGHRELLRRLRHRRRERQALLAPLDPARVVFVVDRFMPRLGMEKAAAALIPPLGRHLSVGAVVVAGPPSATPFDGAVHLGHRRGLLGRVAALPDLRRLGDRRHVRFVTVGIWAAGTFALANLGRAVPMVLWEHSVLPWRLRHDRWVRVGAVVLRVIARRLDRVVCVSRATADTVRGLTAGRVATVVIPNPADAAVGRGDVAPVHEHAGPERHRISILGIGSLVPRKNWRLAIAALALLPEHYELRLAGEGPDRDRLYRLAHELGVEDRVRFLGYVASPSVLLRDADVVAHPSFAETFGYVLMEAAAHHKPVVVLDMPVMTEFVPALVSGTIADGARPEDYATAIQEALHTEWPYADADARRQERMEVDTVVAAWLEVVAAPCARQAGAR